MIRLRKLEEAAERKAYDELVKDITPKKSVEEPFSSYKDQLGFGNHLLSSASFICLFSYGVLALPTYCSFYSMLKCVLPRICRLTFLFWI